MTGPELEQLQTEFEATAAPPPARVTVTLDLDADVAGWFQKQPLGLEELSQLARFFMETSGQPVPPIEAYEDAARWEVEGPAPDRNASQIDCEFIPL